MFVEVGVDFGEQPIEGIVFSVLVVGVGVGYRLRLRVILIEGGEGVLTSGEEGVVLLLSLELVGVHLLHYTLIEEDHLGGLLTSDLRYLMLHLDMDLAYLLRLHLLP